jgi:poly(hydroxyalkanoate) granule-associated protein
MARSTRSRTKKPATPALQRWIAQARDTVVARAGDAQRILAERLSDAQARTSGTIGAVEQVFEKRVSQAMHRLGVPSAREVEALTEEVTRLQQAVEQLRRRRARA